MPQMSPMNWTMIILMTTINLLTMNCIIYTLKTPLNNKLIYNNKLNNWKW